MVCEFVVYGCYVYGGFLCGLLWVDQVVIDEVFDMSGFVDDVECDVGVLLGGECQCVWIVMVFVQQVLIVLFDELMIYFDIYYQFDIFDVLCVLNCVCGLMIVWVLYDLNQVVVYSDEIVLMCVGCFVVQGMFDVMFDLVWLCVVFGVEMLKFVYLQMGVLMCVLVYGLLIDGVLQVFVVFDWDFVV